MAISSKSPRRGGLRDIRFIHSTLVRTRKVAVKLILVKELQGHRAVRGRAAGAQRRCQESGFRNLSTLGARAFRRLGVNLDAIRALRREGDGQSDEFAVFGWNLPAYSADNVVQILPGFKLFGRQMRHLLEKLQIVFIVIM